MLLRIQQRYLFFPVFSSNTLITVQITFLLAIFLLSIPHFLLCMVLFQKKMLAIQLITTYHINLLYLLYSILLHLFTYCIFFILILHRILHSQFSPTKRLVVAIGRYDNIVITKIVSRRIIRILFIATRKNVQLNLRPWMILSFNSFFFLNFPEFLQKL